ncbi:hypothetical protein B0H14DRAFT_2624608 [Mycena olivaceomarginata]|nr:hypothetical protein B0H14DRAFT_2624608 [Mycena olivaceomarginata]
MPIPVNLEISGKARDSGEALMDIIASGSLMVRRTPLTFRAFSHSYCLPEMPRAHILAKYGREASCRFDPGLLMVEHLHYANFATRRTGQLLMPWSRLTKIEVTDPSPQECLDTLVQCRTIGGPLRFFKRLRRTVFRVPGTARPQEALPGLPHGWRVVSLGSRWWTDEQLLALPSPPKVARWSHINIHCGDEEDNVTGELGAKLEQYRSKV